MLKAIKIRLYPNKYQEQILNSLFGSCRFVYNQCLAYKKEKYENEKINISYNDLSKYFHGKLRNDFDWLKEHNTNILKQAIRNLDQAYSNFFKQKDKGYPKFKNKHSDQKAKFTTVAISKNTFDKTSCRLNLTTTIKYLKFKCSDRDKIYLYSNKNNIKNITISKTKTNKYFASILIDGEINKIISKPINSSIGIDLGIKSLLTFSNGESFENPKWIRSNEKRLKKLQRQLSKKFKGSNNRNKARLKLAIKHEKINNQKNNYLHNITSKIINENQVIILEDLNVNGMMQNHKLAKSISELGLYELKRQLEYKSKWYNRDLIFVDRYFASSKTCSCCGNIKSNLKLSDRIYVCDVCGLTIDRDLNASINIQNEGIRIYHQQRIKTTD